MSNLWTLSQVRRLTGALGLALLASTAVAEPARLSVAAVVQAFRAKNGLKSYQASRAELAEAQAQAAGGGFQEAPRLSMELEVATPTTARRGEQDAPPPPGFSGEVKAVASRELILGVDAARNAARYRAQAEADVFEKAAELADEERELVASYLSLKKEALIFAELAESKPKVEKYVSLSRRAARLGTLGGLAATQAEIFLEQVANDIEQSRHSYAAEAERLTASTGLATPSIEAAAFEDAPVTAEDATPGVSPQLAAALRKQSALDLEREDLLSRRTLELGFGVARAFGEKSDTSIIGEITVPLGVGAARKSEAQSLNAERAALSAEADLLKAKAARERARIGAEIKRLSGASARLKGRVDRLTSLVEKTETAFTRGQGEVSEVIATLSELLDARLEAIRTGVELETAQLSLQYLLRPYDGSSP